MLNKYQNLKSKNKSSLYSLTDADRNYIDKTIRYACSAGIGMLEGEFIRKDLIGMALEAEALGSSLEQRLGDAAAFSQSLVSENTCTDLTVRKFEKLYYGIWQVGALLSIMTALFIVPLGMYKRNISLLFILFVVIYAIAAYLVIFNINRLVFASRQCKFTIIIFAFLILPFILQNVRNILLNLGPQLPGAALWIFLCASVFIYITGRLLFENFAIKNARKNHWDLT